MGTKLFKADLNSQFNANTFVAEDLFKVTSELVVERTTQLSINFIDMGLNLQPTSNYTIEMPEGFFVDEYNVTSPAQTISFTTPAAPHVISSEVPDYNIVNDVLLNSSNTTIKLIFDRSVTKNLGSITLHWSGGSFEITNDKIVVTNMITVFNSETQEYEERQLSTFSIVKLDVTGLLRENTLFYLTMPAGLFSDTGYGLTSAEITNPSEVYFTTASDEIFNGLKSNIQTTSSMPVARSTINKLKHTLNNANAYGTSASDWFGYSVATSNSYSIVGAYLEDQSGSTNAGKAYIYSTTNGSLLYTLDNPYPFANGYFGFSVDISENYAIVGAYTVGSNSGRAYIYSTTTGQLLYTLNNPNAYDISDGDLFGYSVAITESYAIVGARGESDAGGSNSGKAYIYSTSTGSLLYTLNNPNAYGTSANDSFGHAVAITESYAIVGAPGEESSSGESSGKAYIYSTSTGSLLRTLDNPNAYGSSLGDEFGYSVAINETYAIVGAPSELQAGSSGYTGKAYIFSNTNGSLVYTLDDPNPDGVSTGDRFGFSVSISDHFALVGAYGENSSSGKAYVFSLLTGLRLFTLDNPNAYGSSANDTFGRSVSISNNYAIVGAHQEGDAGGTSSGKAYIFN